MIAERAIFLDSLFLKGAIKSGGLRAESTLKSARALLFNVHSALNPALLTAPVLLSNLDFKVNLWNNLSRINEKLNFIFNKFSDDQLVTELYSPINFKYHKALGYYYSDIEDYHLIKLFKDLGIEIIKQI